MGRVKLEIKRIENTNNRMVTFAKRKMGLVKKAQELSTLCDIDVALIMFSPGNKLTQYATNSRIEEILCRYANVPEAERAKRKMENLEQLKRAIRKLKGEAEPTGLSRNFLDSKGELNVEAAQEEIRRLQSSNDISLKRLRLWQGDDALLDSCSYEDLLQMEMEVQRTIDKVRMRKQELQFMEYNNSKKVEVSGFGCNAWPENRSRDLDMIKYFNKEEAPSENSSSPGSYFGDQRPFPSVDLNQLEFQPASAASGLLIPGFDLGLQSNSLEQVIVPDRRNNVTAELPPPFQRPNDYQQPHFDGTDPMFFNHRGAGTFMELDCQAGACVVQCDSQADSSQ